jgi:bifunctional DNA-binding transcriptional regulator/antitoxin component of YhaV-PrlF toxin-antitoxin module
MTYTGFIRKLDKLGRITIPSELKVRKIGQRYKSFIKDGKVYIQHDDCGRELDELGRYTIPKESRTAMGYKEKQALKIIEISDTCICFVPDGEKLVIEMDKLTKKDKEAIKRILKI